MADAETAEDADRNVEIWKIKKLIKGLESARGFDFSFQACHEAVILIHSTRFDSKFALIATSRSAG